MSIVQGVLLIFMQTFSIFVVTIKDEYHMKNYEWFLLSRN